MKKTLLVSISICLLAAGCQKQAPQSSAVVSSQTDNTQNSPVVETNPTDDAIFQDTSQVLKNIISASKKASSFSFSGMLTSTGSESPGSYQQTFTNNFSGKLIWPQTEEIINNNHEIITGNSPEDYTQTVHSIVVNNKKFVNVISTGSTPKQGAQGWQPSFVIDPMATKMGVSQQAYKYQYWPTVVYAESLKFVKKDGNVYQYSIVPKIFSFTNAILQFNHQGRLEDGHSPVGANDSSEISGNVWIDKNFFVTKEQYSIQHLNAKDKLDYHAQNEGVDITINYSDYNKKLTVLEPIATPQLDEIAQKIKAGETPEQIEQEMKAEQLSQDPTQGRDSKRRGDILNLKNGLLLYSLSHGSYPADLSVLASDPSIKMATPIAPEPADGSCTEQQNSYVYNLISPKSFSITFCLGVGLPEVQLGPGVHTLTEKGIQ